MRGRAGDELHDVVVQPVALAHAEDRHDIRMVKPRRGPGLAQKPLEVPRVQERVRRQDLECHVAAERLLLGLEDDPHPTTANLAQDAEIGQALGDAIRISSTVPDEAAREISRAGLELLHHDQGRKERADLVFPLGVAVDVFGQGRVLATAAPLEELLGEAFDRVAIVAGIAHGR